MQRPEHVSIDESGLFVVITHLAVGYCCCSEQITRIDQRFSPRRIRLQIIFGIHAVLHVKLPEILVKFNWR